MKKIKVQGNMGRMKKALEGQHLVSEFEDAGVLASASAHF